MKIFSARLKNKKGFSLIECVMAIALFGILSAIALQALSAAVERRGQNSELVRDQNEQLRLIASGEVKQVGVKGAVNNDFKLQSAAGITLSAGYASYNSATSPYVISKPDYDLSVLERRLLQTGFVSQMTAATDSGTRLYSNLALGEVNFEKISDEADTQTIGGVTYNRKRSYEVSFTAETAQNHVTTLKIPPVSNCYFLGATAVNSQARVLGISGSDFSDLLRITDIRGDAKITLSFYYITAADFIGYTTGYTGDTATMIDNGGVYEIKLGG